MIAPPPPPSPLTPQPGPVPLQMLQLAARNFVPMMGFGFVDNFIMIVAGESIEASIGVTLGLSSFAAAGLGNLTSDVLGLGLSSSIEVGVSSGCIVMHRA